MVINRVELLDLLKDLEPGLANNEMIEQSSCLVFTQGEIVSYNDEVSVSCACPYDDLEFVVNGKSLISLLTKLKDKELNLTVNENNIVIKGKNTKAELVTQAEILIPLESIQIPEKWKKIPKNFIEGLQLCLFSAGSDGNKPVLQNIHISKDHIQSSDDYRGTRYFITGNTSMKNLLIPSSSVSNLKKYEPTKYAVIEGWIHFQNEKDIIYSCRVFEGDYPSTDKIYQVKGSDIVLPENLEETLDLSAIFTNEKFDQDKFVTITLSKNKMLIKSQDATGSFQRAIKIKNTKEASFRVPLEFFLQSVKHFEKMVVGDRSMLLKGKGFEHVIALLD